MMGGRSSLEDRLDIQDLMVRYTTALDAGDVDAVVDCFTPDGWLDSPVVGRHAGMTELRIFAERTAEPIRSRGARFRHVISNFRIEVTGARGRVRCYLLDYVTIGEETRLLSPGEYDCEVVRHDGGWRIVSRIVRMDRMFSIP